MWKFTLAAALALSVAGCQSPGGFTRVIPASTPRQIDFFTALNEDCTSRGATVVRVLQAPEHGKLEVRNAPDYPRYSKTNPRNVCNKNKVEGAQIWYVPNPGYVGADRARVSVIFATGLAWNQSFELDVR